MPEPTPDRAGLELPEGALFPSQILARNLGAVRRLRGWRQEFVAERMNFLGHPWTPATVSEAERGRRNVTTDELFSLALVFGLTLARLLDARIERAALGELGDEGLIEVRPKPRQRKVALVRPTSGAASYANTRAPEMLIDAGNLHGVLCGHEVDMQVTWDDLERWRLRQVSFHDKGEEEAQR
jgi:transcriptional regulator with XRE-family HTH domain